jgi:hypothetical protein
MEFIMSYGAGALRAHKALIKFRLNQDKTAQRGREFLIKLYRIVAPA